MLTDVVSLSLLSTLHIQLINLKLFYYFEHAAVLLHTIGINSWVNTISNKKTKVRLVISFF